MRIKFAILVLMACTLMTGTTFAQRGQRSDMAALYKAETDSLIARLALEEEQVEAVQAVLQSRFDKLTKLRPVPGGGREQFEAIRSQMQEIEKETVAALTPLLSEAQMETYQEFMAERQEMRRARRGRQ